jgi:1-deoxy-D-xylulose-5-phosphate reductoisomerase
MSRPLRLTLLGATGSIGQSTLDVVARHPERYEVFALTAFQRVEALADLCRRFQPAYAVVASEVDGKRLRSLLEGSRTTVLHGTEALVAVAADAEVDVVMAAIVGAAGLLPTLAAVSAGKRVLLANKEALVMSGGLFMDALARSNATLLPIDSEHNAIFQCLPGGYRCGETAVGVEQLLLTASGGPFRSWTLESMRSATPAQAVKHPKWIMGRKISVDSASLMNKGLELIEACWLFGLGPDRIRVVIHPESIVHSLVQYEDGSTLAQLGNPDMRTPIALGLAWPERIPAGVSSLDLVAAGALHFEAPDEVRFPCLRLAREAFRQGGCAPAMLNAANEIAVAAFLDEKLAFTDIPQVIERTLTELPMMAAEGLPTILEADRIAREHAIRLLATLH